MTSALPSSESGCLALTFREKSRLRPFVFTFIDLICRNNCGFFLIFHF